MIVKRQLLLWCECSTFQQALDCSTGVILQFIVFNELHRGVGLAATKCGTKFIVLHRDVDRVRTYRAVPLRCKSWSCPSCADKKSVRYGRLIASWFVKKQLYFYTLTFFHGPDPVSVWRNAAVAWNALNIKLHQRYGGFSYVKVLECHHTSNYPHYHILTPRLFPLSNFGKIALACGFGYQIRIKRVNSDGVSGYLRKYLGKSWPRADSARLRSELGLRIFTRSRDLVSGILADSGWRAGRIVSCRENAVVYLLSLVFALTGKNRGDNCPLLHSDCPSFVCDSPPPGRRVCRPDGDFLSIPYLRPTLVSDLIDFEPYDVLIDCAYEFRGLIHPHFRAVNA